MFKANIIFVYSNTYYLKTINLKAMHLKFKIQAYVLYLPLHKPKLEPK